MNPRLVMLLAMDRALWSAGLGRRARLRVLRRWFNAEQPPPWYARYDR